MIITDGGYLAKYGIFLKEFAKRYEAVSLSFHSMPLIRVLFAILVYKNCVKQLKVVK